MAKISENDVAQSTGKKRKQKTRSESANNEGLEKVAEYCCTHVVLFLLTRKNKKATLQDVSDYLRLILPYETGDISSFHHALEQVNELQGDLSCFVQDYSDIFECQSQSVSSPEATTTTTTIRLLAQLQQVHKTLPVEDFYLKSQISMFLQARPDRTSVSHAVGTLLSSIPPAFTATSPNKNALEQLKKRHGRLSSFCQKFQDIFTWQDMGGSKANPAITLISDPNAVSSMILQTKTTSSPPNKPPPNKASVSHSDTNANDYLKARVTLYLQEQNENTAPTGEVGTHLASVPPSDGDDSSALEQLKKRFGRLSSFLKKYPESFQLNEKDQVHLIQQKSPTCRNSRTGMVIPKAKKKEAGAPLRTPVILLRRDDSRSAATEVGLSTCTTTRRPEESNTKSRAEPKPARSQNERATKLPRGKLEEMQAALEAMRQERDWERRAKLEAVKLTRKLEQDKDRVEILWKDARKSCDSVKKQLADSRSEMLQVKNELIKTRELKMKTERLVAKLQLEKDHLVAIWTDARTEVLSTKKQAEQAQTDVRKAHNTLTMESTKARDAVEQETAKLAQDKDRMEALWKDAKAEQEIVKSLLENSKTEVGRLKQLLSNESALRHESSLQLSRALDFLDRLCKSGGRVDGGQLIRFRRELQFTQEKLSRERNPVNTAALASRARSSSMGQIGTGMLGVKPRILLRDEVPRQRPSDKAPVASSRSFDDLEENQHRFDGTKNEWSGGGDGKHIEELNRLDAELTFVAASFGEDEVQVEASKVVRFLHLDIEELSESIRVDLKLNIPDGYPEEGFLRVDAKVSEEAECSPVARKCAMDSLPSMLERCRWEATGCTGGEALLAVLSTADGWVQSDWNGIQSKQFPSTPKRNSDDIAMLDLCHMLLYSHHIIEAEKIQFLKNTASKMGLGGHIRVGKPGYVLLEGLEANCQSYLENLILQRKKLRESSRGGNTDSATFSEVGRVCKRVASIETGRFLPKKLQCMEGPDSLETIKSTCEQVELGEYIEDGLGRY